MFQWQYNNSKSTLFSLIFRSTSGYRILIQAKKNITGIMLYLMIRLDIGGDRPFFRPAKQLV